jgi:hypothetical protein
VRAGEQRRNLQLAFQYELARKENMNPRILRCDSAFGPQYLIWSERRESEFGKKVEIGANCDCLLHQHPIILFNSSICSGCSREDSPNFGVCIMAKSKPEPESDKKLSKRKMVESALNAVGDVGPKDLHQYILDNFKTDVALGIISSYKSQLKSGGSKGTGRRSSGGSLDVRDIATVKELLGRLGAGGLQELIKALSK